MFIKVNGIKLWYESEGTGIPLFLPSYGGILHFQRVLSKELRQRFQMIFIEPRGAGRSESGNVVDLSAIAHDFEEMRMKLGLDRVTILGWSANGTIALVYAGKYPQSVSHLVVSGMPPCYDDSWITEQEDYWRQEADDHRKAVLKKNLARLETQDLTKLSPEERIIREYVANGPKYWFDPEYDCTWIWQGNALKAESVSLLFGELLKDYDSSAQLRKVQCPVLVAQGKYDFVVPPPLVERYLDRLVNVEYVLFDKSGHYPFLEEAGKFNELITRWIESER